MSESAAATPHDLSKPLECPALREALLNSEEPVSSAAVAQVWELLLPRILNLIDSRFRARNLENAATTALEAVKTGVCSLEKLRDAARSFDPQKGRSYEQYLLQRVNWCLQSVIRSQQPALQPATEGEFHDPGENNSPGLEPGHGLPPAWELRISALPPGQRAVWTLRMAPVRELCEADREVMVKFCGRKRNALDTEIHALLDRVEERRRQKRFELEQVTLELKLTKFRRAQERAAWLRSELISLGVSIVDLDAIERATTGWTQEEAAAEWRGVVRRLDERMLGLSRQLGEYSVACQRVGKLSPEMARSIQSVRAGLAEELPEHGEIAEVLGITKEASMQAFKRANDRLLRARSDADEEALSGPR